MAASKVLNGARSSSRISEETRDRILAAAAQLHYRPNATARALANRRMNTIGVVAALNDGDLNNYAMEVLTGVLAASSKHEQSTTLFTLHDWGADVTRLRGWCDGRVDGMILIAPTLTHDAAASLPRHTPFVSLHSNSPLPDVVNIESNEERGAYEVVEYLIEEGHRRIMHVSGDPGLTGAERRVSGYKRALAVAQIPFDEKLCIPSTFAGKDARKTMRNWLEGNARGALPQAVFCANDAIATGCMEAFAEAGLRVPEDISVVGFDDTLGARTTIPQLTTVRQPLREMGARAVEVLLTLIQRHDGEEVPTELPNRIVFPVELVPRASVARPPAGSRTVPIV
jgi:LacI family transcriptional regulator